MLGWEKLWEWEWDFSVGFHMLGLSVSRDELCGLAPENAGTMFSEDT